MCLNFNYLSIGKSFLIVILLAFISASCLKNPGSGGTGKGSSLPNITGPSGEVLIVMDNNLRKSESGSVLLEELEKEYPALPQPEPLFDVIHIPSGAFDDLFKMHRSIVIVDVSSTHKSPEMLISENNWAKPQIVIRLFASDPESMNKLISENKEKLSRTLLQYDRKRLGEVYASTKDVTTKALMSKFGVDISIPRGYNIDINTDEFASLSIETSETSQVIFIYRYPYFDKNDFTTERLIAKRNEFLKKYTVGSRAGSHMTTATIFPPMAFDMKLFGRDFVELRGLWELNKGYMGGPFLSHSTLDTIQNKIVTVEAYVYYPNNKKRSLMRQMEAIVYSFKLL